MPIEQNKKLAELFFNEVCNKRKLNFADELFTNNHLYHDPQYPNAKSGPAGMKEVISTYQNAFPDAYWKVNEMIITENNAITRWTGSGTHKNELQGIQPTGKSVKVEGIWIQRFENGKITESWNVWDTLSLLQQLGAVPVTGHTT